ncbi:MAG: hypothetical protein AABZ53_13630 [Planctomycetota bacterium]
MLGRTKIKVVLSPTALEVSLAGRSATQTIELDQSEWDSHWKGALTSLDSALETALAKLGVKSGTADVCYQSAGATAELVTMPLEAREAAGAAMLRLREAIPGAGIDAPAVLTPVPTRKSSKNGEARSSLFSVADRAETTEALSAWLGRAGLTPGAFTPSSAELLRSAVAAVMAWTEPKTIVVFHLGRHGSGIAGGNSGNVLFARGIGTGYEMLIEAYARAMRACGVESADAATLLFRTGIPARDRVIDEGSGVRGDRIAPLLQPVLQRLAIEIKQTLRFGLPEGEAARVSLVLAGPGAAIHGLAEVLGAQIDISAAPIAPQHAHGATRAAGSLVVALTPMSVRLARSRVGLRMAVQLGAAAAALFIASDFTMSRRALASVRDEIRANESSIEQVKANKDRETRLGVLRDRLGRYDQFLYASVGEKASLAGAVAEMTRLNFEGLRVAELVASHANDGVMLAMKGSLPIDGQGKDRLSGLMERLAASPMFESANLISKQSSTTGADPMVTFSLMLKLVAMDPDEPTGTKVQSVVTGGAPRGGGSQ